MTRWTAADLPALTGRTALVTGASGGLGLITAREFARAGARVVLAVRTASKGEQAARARSGRTEAR
jgi:NAD(P)-dependent dehydrogenase (short-subunit alcohol dehydrogenase family)